MKKYYECELPAEYKEVYHLNAGEKKTGLWLNIGSLIVTVPLILFLCLTMDFQSLLLAMKKYTLLTIFAFVVFAISIFLYLVVHELAHGVAYKIMTKQKLAFGLKWSCAFCGVPNVYVYRKTALISLLTPFVVFSAVLIPMTIICAFLHPLLYFFASILLVLHLGGCIGDIYLTALLLFVYKNKKTLMRDLGAEQYIYLPKK